MSTPIIDPYLKVGQMIDSYRILRFIGRGGMGEVYEAEDNTLNRKVALKVMLPNLTGDANFVRRFLAEGKSLAKINHRNVVAVYALDAADGIYYMAMELIEGQTLDEVITRGSLSDKQVFSYLRQILSGITALHSNHIIHRDLKPKNMIVNKENVLKIVDFGIAKIKFGERELTTAAQGTVIGSINYIAPEVLRGEEASERSDLWSVGVILYEMLYGERLFYGAKPLEVMDRIKTKDPIRLPFGRRLATPKFIIDILKRLIEKAADARPYSARALLSEMSAVTGNTGDPPLPPPPTSLTSVQFENSNPSVSTGRINPKSNRGAAAIAFGVTCAIAFGIYHKMKSEPKSLPKLEEVNVAVAAAPEPPRMTAAVEAPIAPPIAPPIPPPPQISTPSQMSQQMTSPQTQFVAAPTAPVTPTIIPTLAKRISKKAKHVAVTQSISHRRSTHKPTVASASKPTITPPTKRKIIETPAPLEAATPPATREVASVPPVAAPDLAPPKLSLPQEGIAIMAPDTNPVPIVFKWEPADGADAYQLELSPNKNFSSIAFSKKTHDNQLVVRTNLPVGNIYWRVRAKKEKTISLWSSSASFEITKP